MRSPSFRQFLSKEWRELLASRAYWLLLLFIGPLVGQAFITAIRLYAEASGSGAGPAALPQGLTPLDGILVPTLGAYDLAATFLLPFVAIRLISAEKQNGALKLLLQLPGSLISKVAAKGLVLLGGWIVALAPGLLAIILWKSYGGHLYGPETLNLLLGHFLRAMLSVGIAIAAAALSESAASAAIVTLGLTVGSWVLDFIAAGRGGLLQQLASYTPTAALRIFEQGLLQLSTTIVMLAVIIFSFGLAAIWLQTGRKLSFRLLVTVSIAVVVGVVMFSGASVRSSWDLSENRRNSLPAADEAALRQIEYPMRITVILAPEDPRLTDFEQNVLKQLRRSLPRLEVDYAAGSITGLFEGAEDHYGEIWYEMRGTKIMERSTIEHVVLEQVYKLSGIDPPAAQAENEFPGYPLAARPRWASWIFYCAWPLLIIVVWWLTRRERELNMRHRIALITVLALLVIAASTVPSGAQRIPKGGHVRTIHVNLGKEKVGKESDKFLSVVGNWSIVEDGGKKVLGVDGRQWMRGQPAGGLAQKARAIYGSRHEEFIDNVKAFAYFPYAVAKDVDDFHDGDISIRFKLVAGQLDQCAGILFNLKPNGDYLTVRFNGKEDNVVLWTFKKGKRSFVKKGSENVPLQMNTWHTLQISVQGTNLQAALDGKHLLDYTLSEAVSGRIGVWSKTDSVSYFDDYTVTQLK